MGIERYAREGHPTPAAKAQQLLRMEQISTFCRLGAAGERSNPIRSVSGVPGVSRIAISGLS